MKRLLLLAMLALSFLGAASTNIVAPLPECDPCPWVR
jgi:hypothetical protein